MLTGLFAVIPFVVTVAAFVYVEQMTRQPIRDLTSVNIPGLGLVLAVVVVYFSGLLISSLVGKWLVSVIDRILSRIPLLKELYLAWKQISFNPGGGEGIYSKVVLVPDESGRLKQIAFSTGLPTQPGGEVMCVFIPNSPNPVSGRVAFVNVAEVLPLDMTVEEAFKLLLSSGNYVPHPLGQSAPITPNIEMK